MQKAANAHRCSPTALSPMQQDTSHVQQRRAEASFRSMRCARYRYWRCHAPGFAGHSRAAAVQEHAQQVEGPERWHHLRHGAGHGLGDWAEAVPHEPGNDDAGNEDRRDAYEGPEWAKWSQCINPVAESSNDSNDGFVRSYS
eukprot:CAMPEP_0113837388 /NCGR_PEP_ID=MMETSP0328-20130328/9978_1 /TAXON_ID=39455 /ORGANISM="Alexandrium minutum" /LENGTH=141 /DNA_ID=CAMNT_0000805849 /DNA_START=87 /DNA_END=513 /DNA_ORIENTATION=+ /assembly_acc=CAM_ASM_000350